MRADLDLSPLPLLEDKVVSKPTMPTLEEDEIISIKGVDFKVKQVKANGKVVLRMVTQVVPIQRRRWVCHYCPEVVLAPMRPDVCPNCEKKSYEKKWI